MTGRMRWLVATALLALTLSTTGTVLGHDLTPSANSPGGTLPAGGNVTYKYSGFAAGSTLANTVDISLEQKFHDPAWNNSRIPTLSYSPSGTAQVIYSSATLSPCDTGSSAWIQCAEVGGTSSWRIYVRNFGNSGRPTWYWDELNNCSGSTCWYLKRALIHESGHAMVTFPDLSGADEADSVMNGSAPPIAATGGNHFVFRRCDEAALQLNWDVADVWGTYADCFDHLTSHGGLVTELSVAGSSFTRCLSLPGSVSGRLQIKDTTSTGSGTGTYKNRAKNPLAGRTVRIERKPSTTTNWDLYSDLTTTANATGSGNNWTRALPAPAATGTWNYRAYFDGTPGEDLLADGPVTFNVTWTTSCPL